MKKTIALIPGWGFKKSILYPIVELLKENNEVVTIDFPNKHTDTKLHIDDLIFSIAKDIAEQVPQDSIIIGWSLGGLLATAVAYHFPEKCNKLISLCSSPKFAKSGNWPGIDEVELENFVKMANLDLKSLLNTFSILITKPHFNKTLITELRSFMKDTKLDEKELILYLTILQLADMRKFYKSMSIPILHILAEKDALLPLELAKAINSLNCNKNVSVGIIENASHACVITHKDEIVRKIENFVLLSC